MGISLVSVFDAFVLLEKIYSTYALIPACPRIIEHLTTICNCHFLFQIHIARDILIISFKFGVLYMTTIILHAPFP